MSWKGIEKYHKEKERRQKMFEKVFILTYIISLIFLLKFFVVA